MTRCKSKQERDALVDEHLGWAKSVAAKIARKLPTWFTPDDLSGAAMIALIQCAAAYDPETGVPFRAFAVQRIRGACIDAIRRNEYRERRHGELTDKIVDSPESGPETPVVVDRVEFANRELERYVWSLPAEQGRVIRLVYFDGKTVEAAARRMGIHPSRASQHHTAALKALREAMQ